MGRVIPILNQQLDALVAEPVGEDEEYERRFREYVRARVAVQSELEDFLAAQEAYLTQLEKFKSAIAQYPAAAEFQSAALTSPRIVGAATSIRLV